MAVYTNTYLTFDAKGIREQLSNVIYNISPQKTPFISMCAKERAANVLVEWQTDSLAAAVSTNQVLQGDDIASFPAVTATSRVGNYTQISRKLLLLADTMEAVKKAGRGSEIGYQLGKLGAELKRDMEKNAFENIGGVAGGTTTIPKMATLGAWVKSNVDYNTTDGGNPSYTAVPLSARTDGTQRAFTETILKNVLSSMYTSGAEQDYLFVGPVNKAKASAFSGVATKNYDLSGPPRPTAIIASADVYVGEFGTLKIMPSRFQRERDAWLLDFDFLAISHLRPFKTVKLAKTGDAEKRMLLVEWTLVVRQEAALGLAADLTTS